MFDCGGSGGAGDGVGVMSKRGILVGRAAGTTVSGIPKEMMSTILETSLDIVSGILVGRLFPCRERLQRYIASANSGKSNAPDFVVSDRALDKLARSRAKKSGDSIPDIFECPSWQS